MPDIYARNGLVVGLHPEGLGDSVTALYPQATRYRVTATTVAKLRRSAKLPLFVDPRTDGTLTHADVQAEQRRVLDASQFVMGTDAPFTTDQVAAAKAYREAVRQMPQVQTGVAPGALAWPVPPDFLASVVR